MTIPSAFGPIDVGDEFLQPLEHAVAVLRLDVLVVHVEDVVGRHDAGDLDDRLVLLGLQRDRRAVLEEDLAAGHGIEVRDRLRNPVLLDLEVVLGQAGHALALGIRDEDVDVRDGDVHGLGEGRERLAGLGRARRRRSGRRRFLDGGRRRLVLAERGCGQGGQRERCDDPKKTFQTVPPASAKRWRERHYSPDADRRRRPRTRNSWSDDARASRPRKTLLLCSGEFNRIRPSGAGQSSPGGKAN